MRCVITSAVAAQVHGDGAVAGVGKCRDVLSPRPPERGKAVKQQNRRSLARFGDVEAGAVRRDISMLPRPGSPDHGLWVR